MLSQRNNGFKFNNKTRSRRVSCIKNIGEQGPVIRNNVTLLSIVDIRKLFTFFTAVSGADGGESSGEKAAATGAAPETIPEGEGEEESKETTEGAAAAAAADKDKDVLKGTEEEAKDTKEVESDAGKATEASTSLPEPSKVELKTEGQSSESKADVESEEPSAESKPDVKSEVDSNESKDDVKSEEPSAESKDLSSEDKVDAAVKQDGTKTRSPENTEEIFASAALERLLGLLGAILPQDSKVGHIVVTNPAHPHSLPLSLFMIGLWFDVHNLRQTVE